MKFDTKPEILILSCKKYTKVANITLSRLIQYGAHNYFNIKIYPSYPNLTLDNNIEEIRIKNEADWSSDLLEVLRSIKGEYLLLWLDDLVPIEQPNFEKIRNYFEFVVDNNANHLRLNPMPPARGSKIAKGISEILFDEPYRCSTVFSIWKKTVLIELLQSGESAWQFEIFGSIRSSKISKFYSADCVNINHKNTLIRGKIDRKCLPFLTQEEKLSLLKIFPLNNFYEQIKLDIVKIRHQLMSALPISIQNIARSFWYR